MKYGLAVKKNIYRGIPIWKLKTLVLITIVFVIQYTFSLPGAQAEGDDATKTELEALRQQVNQLDQKLKVLQENEATDQTTEQKSSSFPKITASSEGFRIDSPDKSFDLKIGGLTQVDTRNFLSPAVGSGADGFFLRRARLIFSGSLYKNYEFLFEPEFGSSSGGVGATIQNAYINVHYWDEFQAEVGRFKGPIGYERSVPTTYTLFLESGLPQNLTPYYDQGVLFHGKVFNGIVDWAAGAVNGSRDNASDNTTPLDNNFEFTGKVYVNPFEGTNIKVLKGLGGGLAGGVGNRGNSTAVAAPAYVTPGQQSTGLAYNAGTAEEGETWRLAPVLYYYYGPFGAFSEYHISSEDVTRSVGAASRTANVENRAWQVVGSYVLTGEDAAYTGVKPLHNFSFKEGGWGAWQLAARYGELDYDENLFSGGAGGAVGNRIATGPQDLRSFGLGVNWYLNTNVKVQLNFDHTDFAGGTLAVTPQTADENLVSTRLQLAF